MTTFKRPCPTADDFKQLGDIWRREADGREALGAALQSVLGNDLGLAAEAAALRRRAQTPQGVWPMLISRYGPSSPMTVKADRQLPEGLDGPLIAQAAETKLIGGSCCDRCQSALQITAQALRDFSAWVSQHIHPCLDLSERAAWDTAEADHLRDWAGSLRTGALAEAVSGIPS